MLTGSVGCFPTLHPRAILQPCQKKFTLGAGEKLALLRRSTTWYERPRETHKLHEDGPFSARYIMPSRYTSWEGVLELWTTRASLKTFTAVGE